MATCRLIIELEEPAETRKGGDPISGVVLVDAEKETNCTGLIVSTGWHTHGLGNIAQGEVEQKKLFEGSWQPGKQYRYPFTLLTATWPPTYYGHHLNVDHFVNAEATIPWASNAKTVEIFSLVADKSPEDLTPVDNRSKRTGWITRAILLFVAILLFSVAIPFAMIVTPIAVVGYSIYWFFFKLMPRRITGDVSLVIQPDRLTVGQSIHGTCSFTPRKNSTINGIRWTIRCVETCVSGSGSNRKANTHEVLSKTKQLMEACDLQAGKLYEFDFEFAIPLLTPPSMTFTDNRIEWSSELRIDIPRWPDWSKTIPFIVNVKPANAILSPATGVDDNTESVEDDDPWLTEVLQQVIQSHDDSERLEVVIEAIVDQNFAIFVDVQGKVDEPYEADIDDVGNWVAAVDTRRNIRMVLFVPESLFVDRIAWARKFRGQAKVLGYEANADRVMMRLIDQSSTTTGH